MWISDMRRDERPERDTNYEMSPSIGSLSLYFATPLAYNAPTEVFPWDILRNILREGQDVA